MTGDNHEDSSDESMTNVPEYKVSEKKTIEEYANLDAEDESLRKWKESLGLTAGGSIGAPGDKRRVVVLEMTMNVEGQDPVTFNLEDQGVVEKLKKNPIVIKERSRYHLNIKFRVQHDIVTGLRYIQVAKRGGIRASKTEEVCGSYPPNTKEKPFYIKDMSEGEAPGGMLARGTYTALSTFKDDDGITHLEIPWGFEIKK
ncbi:rho GDP-dissociation inhibitor [Trichomonascus vanleenenianus]|uniref:Rdi1p n=1 Tax=Trichomonascus vanleenenianus TaxID=2268995 RepID=UPI003ECAC1BB